MHGLKNWNILSPTKEVIKVTYGEFRSYMKENYFGKSVIQIGEHRMFNGVYINTVLLSVDHSKLGGDFETMVFNLPNIEELQFRCYTYKAAQLQHAETVQLMQKRFEIIIEIKTHE